jgi:hypothetical protein
VRSRTKLSTDVRIFFSSGGMGFIFIPPATVACCVMAIMNGEDRRLREMSADYLWANTAHHWQK